MKKQSNNSLTVEKLFPVKRAKQVEANHLSIKVGVSIKAYRDLKVHCIGQIIEKNLKTDTMTVVDIDNNERYFPIRNGALTYEIITLKTK